LHRTYRSNYLFSHRVPKLFREPPVESVLSGRSSSQKPISYDEPCYSEKHQEIERIERAVKEFRILQVAENSEGPLEIMKKNCGVDLATNKVKQA
jgi:hypothetical protein